jgi:hypothetical protein
VIDQKLTEEQRVLGARARSIDLAIVHRVPYAVLN